MFLHTAVNELPRHGVTVVTGRGQETGGRTQAAVRNRLTSLMQSGILVRSFVIKEGAIQVQLLRPI